jgi:hypothetical protein
LGGLLALNMLSFNLLISFGENCKKNENKTLITSSGRNQCLAQATQPDQTPSRIGHDTTRPRNPIRENKIEWANIAGWTK